MQTKGPNTYIVRVPGNKKRFVHADHLMHGDVERELESKVRHELVTDLPPCSDVVPTKVPVNEPTVHEEDSGVKPVDREPDVTAREPEDCNVEKSDVTGSNSSPSKGETQVFFSRSSPLSNFYQCSFKVDGAPWNSISSKPKPCILKTYQQQNRS